MTLLRRTKRLARALLNRLRARPVDRPFRPRYDPVGLPARIARSRSGRRAELLRDARAASRAGRRDEAMALVVRHVDEANARLAFAPTFQWSLPDSPLDGWITAAAAQARDFVERGLPIYGLPGSRLRPGYPWRGEPGIGNRDVLLAVRAHRFAFLPRLALAVRHGALTAAEVDAIVADWAAFAAREPALPYISNLVVVQRIFALTFAFHALQGASEDESLLTCRYRLLAIIEQDIAYLLPRLGHSFPNNHLLVDRFAAWFIALHYPWFHAREPDLDALEASWLAELRAQTYDDGGGIEHSVHYHGLACEMAARYVVLARAAGRAVPPDMVQRIARMLRLQSDLCGPDGHAPAVGDSSDDALFPFDDGSRGNAAAFREIDRTLFDPAIPALRPDHPARERAFWICNGVLPSASPAHERRVAVYPDAGFVVLFDDCEATRCVLRTGPSTATKFLPGHMHADPLSVTLTVGGRPILVDAGTCGYRFSRDPGATNWRDYFAGPRAHNGLVVADVNPFGPLRGDFRSKASVPSIASTVAETGDAIALREFRMEPSPTWPGWTRGIVHLRGVGFVVYDIVDGDGAEQPLHFAMQLDAASSADAPGDGPLTLRNGDVTLACAHSEGLDAPDIVRGRERPPNGWVSRSYADRTPAPQLLFRLRAPATLTAFAILGDVRSGRLSIQCARPLPDARCFCIDGDGFRDFVLIDAGRRVTPFSHWGIDFEGRLGWIRIVDGSAPQLRWLAGTRCEAPALGLQGSIRSARAAGATAVDERS